MGYRSDVAYKIWFEDVGTRDTFIDLVIAKGSEHLVNALKECEIGTATFDHVLAGAISFQERNTKWYEGFPDIDAHHRLIQLAEEILGEHMGARFVRLGEENDDVEERSYGNPNWIDEEDIEITRELSFEGAHNSVKLDLWLKQHTQTT